MVREYWYLTLPGLLGKLSFMNFKWLTGFYEGEGNPGWSRSGRRLNRARRRKLLRIVIIQKERTVLLRIASFLRKKDFIAGVYPRRERGRATSWMLTIAAPHSYRLAETMLPLMYSTWKRRQLKAALRGVFKAAKKFS